MGPSDLDKEVSRVADTPGMQIGIAEVARVRSCLFRVLVTLPPSELMHTLTSCLKTADARRMDEAMSDA